MPKRCFSVAKFCFPSQYFNRLETHCCIYVIRNTFCGANELVENVKVVNAKLQTIVVGRKYRQVKRLLE